MSKESLIGPEDWRKVGEIVKGAIDSHFAQGKGPDGKPFKPYSEEYAEELKESGASTKPDNQRTGAFRASFKITPKQDGVEVASHGSPGQMIGWSKANAIRPVVGLGPKEVGQIMDAIGDAIEARLKEIANG